MSVVNVAALRGFRELVAEIGGDARALLTRARIRADALDDPRNFVPYASFVDLLEHAAHTLRCPDFGLRLSTRQDVDILGPLAVAVRNSATLGDALACASRYLFTHSPAIAFTTRSAERDDGLLVAYEIRLERARTAVQEVELSVALAARVVALLSEGRHHLRRVWFAHPRRSPLPVYRAHFGVPVVFERNVSALEIDAADLALSIPSSHPELRELAEHYLQSHFGAHETPLVARVREVLLHSLGTGRSSCVEVGAVLGMHPRALQRRLRADGASFEQIKDAARADLAHRYLAQEKLSLSQVALLLDYSEQSALTRSCYRWFARSPRAMRVELIRRASAVEAPPREVAGSLPERDGAARDPLRDSDPFKILAGEQHPASPTLDSETSIGMGCARDRRGERTALRTRIREKSDGTRRGRRLQ